MHPQSTRQRIARVLMGLLVAGGLVQGAAVPAAAQERVCEKWETKRVEDPETGESGWEQECERWSEPEGNPASTGSSGWQPVEGAYAISLTTIDGERCWRVIWVDLPGYERPDDAWTWSDAYAQGQETWGDRYPECPGADEPDPTGAVRAVWASTSLLPDTELHVAPGWALTGMPAYLEIRGQRTLEATEGLPAPFNSTATLSAEATFTVRWGDGHETTGVQTLGGPWPDGDVVHTYAHADDVVITVVAEWAGQWTVGGRSGALPPITVEHDLPLEVRQLQAVRVAPGS